jgi:hypothetical protein
MFEDEAEVEVVGFVVRRVRKTGSLVVNLEIESLPFHGKISRII